MYEFVFERIRYYVNLKRSIYIDNFLILCNTGIEIES